MGDETNDRDAKQKLLDLGGAEAEEDEGTPTACPEDEGRVADPSRPTEVPVEVPPGEADEEPDEPSGEHEADTWVGDAGQLEAAGGLEGADAANAAAAAADARNVLTSLDSLARDPGLARLVGAVLGAAIGDAMGHPTEFISSVSSIRERFGPDGVTGYALYKDGPRGRFAPFTDDTQMAEAVLRSLEWAAESHADLEATMVHMAGEFVEWSRRPKGGHRAPGNACLAGCRALERGVHWSQAGGPQAGGCGSVMRAYPFGLYFAQDLAKAEHWAAQHSRLTHGDPIALAASAAMAVGMARTFRGEPIDVVLSEMVAAACRYSPATAAMMAEAIADAKDGVEPDETLDRLLGWAAHEAIAAAVYIVARHPDDPRTAILEGANTPGDSDSIATLAGALTGCRAGLGAIPEEWVRDLERVNELIALACRIPA